MIEEIEISRKEIEGKRIVTRLLKRDVDLGGMLAEILGSQGSGKTAVMLALIENTLLYFPHEKIFFSNSFRTPIQTYRLPEKYTQILVEKNSGVKFFEIIDGGHEVNVGQIEFTDFDDLYSKAEDNKINVVFFKDRITWRPFMMYLMEKLQWTWIFLDEVGEIIPYCRKGQMVPIGEWVEQCASQIRKCLVNLIYTSQAAQLVDYRFRKVVMMRIYMPGSKKADSDKSRVKQTAIDCLRVDRKKGNFGWVEFDGAFGCIQFQGVYLPPPRKIVARVMEVKNGTA